MALALSIHNKLLRKRKQIYRFISGDIELTGYLTNVSGTMSLVMDLRNVHECWGSNSDPNFNGHLHYPNDVDRPLNETPTQ